MSAVRFSSTPFPRSAYASKCVAHNPPAPPVHRFVFSMLIVIIILLTSASTSFAQDSPEVIRQKIEAEYPLTKTTAGRDDIVTAGAVLVLEKDGLEMSVTTNNVQAQDTYKGGKLSASGGTSFAKNFGKCTFCPHNDKAGNFRTFVAGEKFWITKVEVHDDGVLLSFFSDPISDIRYVSTLKIPYTKGTPQTAAALLSTIAEVIKVQPSDDAKTADKSAPVAAPAAAPAPMAAIPPPPPPPDAPPAAPPTVAIGQTKVQVVALLGTPTRIAKLPTKEIDFYPNMKITFVKDKVSDIQ